MIKVAEFMKRHGMDAERVDLAEYTRTFADAMREGLKAERDEVPMLPAYIMSSGRIPDGTAAVIDAGGTNFRAASVSFKGGTAAVEDLKSTPMPGSQGAVTWDELISHAADCVAPYVKDGGRIGFCFSYPVGITPERDGIILSLTKQLDVKGAVGQHLGASLREELIRRGINAGKITVLNDTAAALLAGKASSAQRYNGYIGLIAGTGCNTCCELPIGEITKLGIPGREKMLVTLESGSFSGFPRGDADIAMDADLPDTGKSLAEKMTSGRYLGNICMYTLRLAADEGIFSPAASEMIGKMTDVATPTIDKWGSGRFPKGITSEDKVNLVYIINEIIERAARCIACMLCGIMEITGAGQNAPACIAVDGSLFTRGRLLRPELERLMDISVCEIMGRDYRFVTMDNMSVIGTAAAALKN